jgi:hypothetical protein
MPTRSSINTVDIQQLINSYYTTHSYKKTAKLFGITEHLSRKMLLDNGVVLNSSTHNTKHHLKDEFCLKNIDSEWKAYFLGLICADGNISKRKTQITLQEQDAYILHELAKLLYTDSYHFHTRPAKKPTHQDQISMRIENRKFTDIVKSHDIPERKSLILNFPKTIPSEMMHHFVRGYFDGDGSISGSSRRKSEYRSTIIGSVSFITTLSDILTANNIHNKIRFLKNKPVIILEIIRKHDLVRFHDFIYKDANLLLKRKYEKFQNMIKDTDFSLSNFHKEGSMKHINYIKRNNCWAIRKYVNGKRKQFGSFKTREEAEQHYSLLFGNNS